MSGAKVVWGEQNDTRHIDEFLVEIPWRERLKQHG